MLKIVEILSIGNLRVECKFNTGVVKTLDVRPLIESQQNLQGINKLLDNNVFRKVKIGSFGEIYWEQLITTTLNNKHDVWDYDISPEFFFYNANK